MRKFLIYTLTLVTVMYTLTRCKKDDNIPCAVGCNPPINPCDTITITTMVLLLLLPLSQVALPIVLVAQRFKDLQIFLI